MRIAIYIASWMVSLALLVFGLIGSLGNAVSYKYEVEDPIGEITMDRLPPAKRNLTYEQLEEKKSEIEFWEYFLTGLVILSIVSLILLLVFRKRLLGKVK